MNTKIITFSLILVVILFGYFIVSNKDEFVSYESDKYGFSFNIPKQYDVMEYTEEILSIGNRTDEGFDALAEVHVIKSEETNENTTFEDFVYESMRNACAADGPSETIYCNNVVQVQLFSSLNGSSGNVFYLNRVHENFRTMQKLEDAFGPIFVFNIQANVPESKFSALVVRPPSNLSASTTNSVFIRSVAESVRINLNQ